MIADEIRRRRLALDSTGRHLARVSSEFTSQTISNVETGRFDPKLSTIEEIIRTLGGRLTIEWQEDFTFPPDPNIERARGKEGRR